MAQAEATLRHYLEQWDTYFTKADSSHEMLLKLQENALNGRLRSCNFRGVCWRVFLQCIPEDTAEWEPCIKKSRDAYDEIKKTHITNPRLEAKQEDLQHDNPLSQSDESSWQKYFKNNELITMIKRDVRRTFPEMEYFHNASVREMMVDVLFCYAREHMDLSYRQGMHELLAPLLFILHCDLQAACHASEIGELYPLMTILLDQRYLEHDAYEMFCQLMKATNSWYSMSEKSDVSTTKKEEVEEEEKPFTKPVSTVRNGPTLAITNKLSHIHNTLLSQHDIELYTYLNRLEIIPQVYGLRWIRLLFGREFCLQDLLVLWDAIFADNCSLDLVDYIFVAMLIHMRNKLIDEEYSICMQLLMKFPPIEDINDLVSMAKSIRNCKVGSIKTSFKVQTKSKPPIERMKSNNQTSQNKFSKFFSDISKQVNEISITNRKSSRSSSLSNSLQDPVNSSHSQEQKSSKLGSIQSKSKSKIKQSPPKELLSQPPVSLENHVLMLQSQLENLRQMCEFCADKIDSSVRVLQPELKILENNEATVQTDATVKAEGVNMTNKLKQNQQNLVAVASLKQVRDILRGTLSFNLSINDPSPVSPPSILPSFENGQTPTKTNRNIKDEHLKDVPYSISNDNID